MLDASERCQVELIFRHIDAAGSGALSKASIHSARIYRVPAMSVHARHSPPSPVLAWQEVLEQLAARLNPDISFSPFQLTVIADEVPLKAM